MMSRDFRDFRKGLFLNCNGKRGRVELRWNCAWKSTMCVRSPFFDDGDVLERFAPTTLTLRKQDVIHHSSPLSSASWAELLFTLTTTAACILPCTGHHTIHTDKLVDHYSLTKSPRDKNAPSYLQSLCEIHNIPQPALSQLHSSPQTQSLHLLSSLFNFLLRMIPVIICNRPWSSPHSLYFPCSRSPYSQSCKIPALAFSHLQHVSSYMWFLWLLKMCCEKVSSVFVSLDVLLFLHLPLLLPLDQLDQLGKENRLANLHSQKSRNVSLSRKTAGLHYDTFQQPYHVGAFNIVHCMGCLN